MTAFGRRHCTTFVRETRVVRKLPRTHAWVKGQGLGVRQKGRFPSPAHASRTVKLLVAGHTEPGMILLYLCELICGVCKMRRDIWMHFLCQLQVHCLNLARRRIQGDIQYLVRATARDTDSVYARLGRCSSRCIGVPHGI